MSKKEQMQQLEKTKIDQNKVQHQNQEYQPPQAPLDQLRQHLDSMEQDIHLQQLTTEASLEDTFSQAAEGLRDTKAVAQLLQLSNSLGNLVKNQGLQGSVSQYHELLAQIDQDLHQQIQSCSQQVMRSLQQGVTALAQANAVMLDNQSYQQVLYYVHQCQLLLTDWQAGNGENKMH